MQCVMVYACNKYWYAASDFICVMYFHVPSFSLLLLLFNLCSPMISRHQSCLFSSSVLRVYSRNRFGASKEKGFSQICGQCVSSSIDKNLFHRMHLQTRCTSCSLFLSFDFVPRPQTIEGSILYAMAFLP